MRRRRFRRNLPLPTDAETAFEWHARPGAFDRLVPPWRDVRVIEQRGGIETGAELIFRAGMGPVGMRWHAVHEDFEPGRQFVDVQAKGPFAYWRHVHRFETVDGQPRLVDDIEYALPGGFLGQRLGGAFAERDLERMFAYRHATTAADLALHARYDDALRSRVVIGHAGHPLAETVSAMFTTGGHAVTTVQWPASAPGATPTALVDAVRATSPEVVIIIDPMNPEPVQSTVEELLGNRPSTLVVFRGYDHDLNQSVANGETFTDEDSSPRSGLARTVVLKAGTVLVPGESLFDRAVFRARLGLMMTLSSHTKHAWISRDDAAAAIVHAACDHSVHGAHSLAAEGTVTPRTLGRAAWGATWARNGNQSIRRVTAAGTPAGFPALRHPTLASAFRYLLGHHSVENQAPHRTDSAEDGISKGALT